MAEFIFKVGVGTRAKESSAAAAVEYIVDESDSEISNVYYQNIPEFASENPPTFFEAVDRKERKNGVLYRSMMCGIPRELDENQAIALVKKFVDEVTGGQGFPAAIAFHDLGGTNPHAHVIFSERSTLLNGVSRDELDGVVRDAKGFFKRADSNNPANGGVPKAMIGKNDEERREWLMAKRELWQDMSNEALEAAGFDERVSCKSLLDQGILDRTPQKKKSWMIKNYEQLVTNISTSEIKLVRKEIKNKDGVLMLANQIKVPKEPAMFDGLDQWRLWQKEWKPVKQIKDAMQEVELSRPKLVSAIRWHDTREHHLWLERDAKRLKLKAEKEKEFEIPFVIDSDDQSSRDALDRDGIDYLLAFSHGALIGSVGVDDSKFIYKRGTGVVMWRERPEGMVGLDIKPRHLGKYSSSDINFKTPPPTRSTKQNNKVTFIKRDDDDALASSIGAPPPQPVKKKKKKKKQKQVVEPVINTPADAPPPPAPVAEPKTPDTPKRKPIGIGD